jgi:hypothetical protein
LKTTTKLIQQITSNFIIHIRNTLSIFACQDCNKFKTWCDEKELMKCLGFLMRRWCQRRYKEDELQRHFLEFIDLAKSSLLGLFYFIVICFLPIML